MDPKREDTLAAIDAAYQETRQEAIRDLGYSQFGRKIAKAISGLSMLSILVFAWLVMLGIVETGATAVLGLAIFVVLAIISALAGNTRM